MPLRILRTKLLPARKAWKTFTTMLRAKLYKFRKSKHDKNRRQYQLHAIRKQALKASSSHRLVPRHQNHIAKSSQHRYYKCHVLRKKCKPVYIDDLFIEHAVPESVGGSLQPLATHKGYKATGGTRGDSREKTSKKTDMGADDMWESLVLASPQMFGIDARAEEFIAKFREELKTQERLTRRLQQ